MKSIDFNKLRKNINVHIEKQLANKSIREENSLNIIKGYISFDLEKNLNVVKGLNLNNIKFKNIDFENIDFENCSFENSIFINCRFNKLNFINCNMQNAIFKDLNIVKLTTDYSILKKSIISKCSINRMIVKDCDFKSFKFVESNINYFEFDDSLVSRFDEETFFDKSGFKNKENSYKFYRDIAYKFQQNNLLNHYGEYFYIYKNMERNTLKGLSKFKSIAFWLICGYGERPTYALITSLEMIFIFTVLYMAFGLNLENEIISYRQIYLENKSLILAINDFIRAFHFSIVTFTTVGYGDVTPIGHSILLSGLEMFLGVTMVGIWTATLARKINR
ncbi:voltage-gated potassium channel [uncultured Clostridium sp.]|nr:voltage-gated potassium channel [uncultured Clostridium sp.]SCJ10171.1 voltage-gated potassium channel [uncultured Clostridium sp.]